MLDTGASQAQTDPVQVLEFIGAVIVALVVVGAILAYVGMILGICLTGMADIIRDAIRRPAPDPRPPERWRFSHWL
jgi:uncharacterized membrane protein